MDYQKEIDVRSKLVRYFERRIKELQRETTGCLREPRKEGEMCSFCKKKTVYAKGLCNNCYARFRKRGTPEYAPKKEKAEKPVIPWRVKLCDDAIGEIEDKPSDFDSSVDYVLTTLTEKEQRVIAYRYKEKLALEESGKREGVTRERIRQIQQKALRKMRNPSRSNILRFGIKETERKKEEERKAFEAQAISEKGRLKRLYEQGVEIGIEDLDLSVRAYNCLARANVYTFSDLLKMSSNEIYSLHQCGRKTTEEICYKVREKIGVELDGETPKETSKEPTKDASTEEIENGETKVEAHQYETGIPKDHYFWNKLKVEDMGFSGETLEILQSKGIQYASDVFAINRVVIDINSGEKSCESIMKAVSEIEEIKRRVFPCCGKITVTVTGKGDKKAM